jgi:hypothetical protein
LENLKKRVSMAGLRSADPTTLLVLTQDILTVPLVRLDPNTLADLLALSELEDGLPLQLKRDLAHFRPQMFREMSDLPDGIALVDWVVDMQAVQSERAPQCLRDALIRLRGERRQADSLEAIDALAERWAIAEPSPVVLRKPADRQNPVATPKLKVLPPVKAPKAPKAGAGVPAAQKDTRREEWIAEDVLARLRNYASAGLKESVVVAGARHRAPWKDMTEAEVLAVLRQLARDGRVRTSAGRWSSVTG